MHLSETLVLCTEAIAMACAPPRVRPQPWSKSESSAGGLLLSLFKRPFMSSKKKKILKTPLILKNGNLRNFFKT